MLMGILAMAKGAVPIMVDIVDERLELARKHLDQSPILTVSDYMELTGLRHTMAARELRDWAGDPESGIRKAGRGSHRYYTK